MKQELITRFVEGNFGKASEEKSIFSSNFSSNWKERSSRFDLYLMKMKQNFESDIHFTLRRMLWEGAFLQLFENRLNEFKLTVFVQSFLVKFSLLMYQVKLIFL